LYTLAKGNTFKHKRAIVEEIHKQKAEYVSLIGCRLGANMRRAQRSKILQDQMEARRLKSKAARERRQNRILEKRNAFGQDETDTAEKK
jgi:large subunit ribosomal protein L19e